jgi:hypothetical protein
MNRQTSHRMRLIHTCVSVLLITSAADSARCDDVFPFLPLTEEPPRVQRLEIVDAPDPIGNGITLYRSTGGRLNAPTYHQENAPQTPDVAVDPATGWTVVGWREQAASGYDIVVVSVNALGWGQPCRVAEGGASGSAPTAVFMPDGSLTVLYVGSSGAASRVFSRTASPPDWNWSPPQPVSVEGEEVGRVHATAHDGQLHVVYTRRDGPVTSLVHAVPNGATYDRSVIASSSFAGDTLPQIHSHAGALWVDWVDAEAPTGAGELAWKRHASGSTWEPTQYEPYASPFERDYHVRPGIRLEAIVP